MSKKYILQVGLAFTLLYAGIDSFLHTMNWLAYVPIWIEKFGVSQQLALHAHSVVEILLAVLLLSNWKTNWVAAITAADMLVILLVNGFGNGIFFITFRDVGLLSMAIYLALE